MITADAIKAANLPVSNDDITIINVDAALDYIADNSTLTVDKTDISSLPSAAKLFIVKYNDVMSRAGISSESVGGMSQSFNSGSTDTILLSLFNSLLGKYAKSQMTVVQCDRRWDYERKG